jgi:hypothetical protein
MIPVVKRKSFGGGEFSGRGRFPISGSRIPNSVWHMQDLEYRTMYGMIPKQISG